MTIISLTEERLVLMCCKALKFTTLSRNKYFILRYLALNDGTTVGTFATRHIHFVLCSRDGKNYKKSRWSAACHRYVQMQ